MTERNRFAIAGGETLVLAASPALPNRPVGMDHVGCRQPITPGDLGIAGVAAMELTTLFDQLRPCGAMDRAIHAAAAEQRGNGGVDDAANAQRGDVGNDDLEPGLADRSVRPAQAYAAGPAAMPLSVMCGCSSPL